MLLFMKHKIVVCPDSFKGSISAQDAAWSIAKGLCASFDCETVCLPIADGGEGTLDALVTDDKKITVTVCGPYNKKVDACYGIIGERAVIEMATAAGLTLQNESERCVKNATTYGVGELIKDALSRGSKKILLTVGGSGTNDGGCGMLAALGGRFLDKDGNEFLPVGATLGNIEKIDISELDRRLFECEITIATDVKNTLTGGDGATYVYARQKGANDYDLLLMEKGMCHYAEVVGNDIASIEGAGAGGGLAVPLLAFCNAKICSGIDAVLDACDFENKINGATAIITGEGKLDRQSLFGKTISGVTRAAAKKNIPVFCIVGCVGDDKEELKSLGICDIFTLNDISPNPEYSMTHADTLLYTIAKDNALKIIDKASVK